MVNVPQQSRIGPKANEEEPVTDRYPTVMLHNTKTDRWHPMPFQWDPLPGGELTSSYRYKSLGHHTDGFATVEEATAYVKSKPEFVLDGGALEWDGEETPATVLFFDKAWIDSIPPMGAEVDHVLL